MPNGFRFATSVALAALVHCTLCASLPAQPPKVYATPERAAADPDFSVQGEYVGGGQGLQVVALGDGEFQLVLYPGGLPGEGWTGEPPRRIDSDADGVDSVVESQGMKRVERKSPTLGAAPPPGAVVLFDGTQASLENWKPGARIDNDGLLMQGATSQKTFGDYSIHLEFRTPYQPTASGQQRGNSGLYHQGRYETQILDSFGLSGANNETGAIYNTRRPDVNACLPPLSWQTYDVNFTAARFDANGKKISNARLTVRLNGVVVQNNIEVPASTRAAPLGEGPGDGPIYLQDHGNPVRFRNIWVLPRDAAREARRPLLPAFERFHASAAMSGGDETSLANGGQLLAESVGCFNCHGTRLHVWEAAIGPVLSGVASRVRPDHLVQWLKDPRSTKLGTTMPDVLGKLPEGERDRAAKALASYLLLAEKDTALIDMAGDPAAAKRGDVLYHSIGCIACHAPQNEWTAPPSTSVPLGPVGEKYTLDSLTLFLQNPHVTRPDGRMPRLVADESEARDIATYLLRDTVLVPGAAQFKRTVYRGSWDSLPDFTQLQPTGEAQVTNGLTFEGIQPLNNFAASYQTYLPIRKAGTYELTVGSDDGSRVLVDGNEVARVDGIHPYQKASGKIDLQPGVYPLVVEYFEGAGEERLSLEISGPGIPRSAIDSWVTQDPEGNLDRELVPATFQPDPELFADGQQLFASLGCADCHAFEPEGQRVPSTLEAAAWSKLDPTRGCLSATDTGAAPDYELTSAQRRSLAAAIERNRLPSDRASLIDLTLKAANCYACHERDGVGGPELVRTAFFQTTTPEMGNEGRIPPPLTGVGDKLTDTYFAKVLSDGANMRPYMKTRMPAFGYDRMKLLHQRLIKQDRESNEIPETLKSTLSQRQAHGRVLVGNDGLACIKCHTYGGEGTPGIQAIDMLEMPARLRKDWFVRYLLDPQAYRPGTRMPASFPKGVSVLPSIADGDANYQILAMWDYLELGDRSRVPTGLRPGAIELKPTDRPILYRSFLEGLSNRGIAVGYPEGVNLAWDAGSMSLAMIWQNQFLDVSKQWRGRGPGTIGPLGDAVLTLEKAAPVAVLEQFDSPWPQATDKANGYQFSGYELTADGRPTFLYRVAGIAVRDQFTPHADDTGKKLERTLSAAQSDDQTVFFQLAQGELRELGNNRFRVNDRWNIEVREGEAQILTQNGTPQLRVRAPGNNSVTVIYQW